MLPQREQSGERHSGSGRVLYRTGMFMFAAVFARASGLLILPVLIMLLSPAEFTRFGLMTSLFILAPPLLSLNIHLAPVRLFYDYKDAAGQSELMTTTLTAALAMSALLLAGALLAIVAGPIDDPVSSGNHWILVAMCFVVLCRVMTDFGANAMRVLGHSGTFVLLSMVQGGGLIVGVLVLPWLFTDNILMLAVTYLLTGAAAAALALRHTWPLLQVGNFRFGIMTQALLFSWPMSINFVMGWTQQQSGRWIGAAAMSLEALAPYTLVMQFVIATAMLVRAAGDARVPDIGRAFAEGQYARGIAITRHTIAVGLGAVLAVYAVCLTMLTLLSDYVPAGFRPPLVLLLLGLGVNLVDAMSMLSVYRLVAIKRTGSQAIITFIGAALTLAAMVVLVQYWNDVGLLLGALIGGTIQAALLYGVAHALVGRHMRQAELPAAAPEVTV